MSPNRKRLLGDLGQDLGIADEQVFVLADLDRVTSPARQEDLVTGLDRGRDDLAVLIGGTGASGDDASLGKRGGSGGRGDEETGRGLCLGLEALYENAVEEGDDRLDGADGGLGSLFAVKHSDEENACEQDCMSVV